MTKTALSVADKTRLKFEIKLSFIIGIILMIALIILISVIPFILFQFGKQPANGFIDRISYILCVFFVLFLAISWPNILKLIDIIKGDKFILNINEYEIVNVKGLCYILTKGEGNRKIKIDGGLVVFINELVPLILEITPISKSVLFISHDLQNLLDKSR